MIKENIEKIHIEINKAALKSDKGQNVTLICVSKTKPVEMVLEAYNAGERVFGENKVQEICEKAPVMPKDAKWHMIGHLQKNKVRKAVQFSDIIHSVDSIELAECIDKEANRIEKIQDILLELNIASEESKYGLDEIGLKDILRPLSELNNIRLRGLMCVAPYTDMPEENRKYFRKMRELLEYINSTKFFDEQLNILSMGMSNDFKIAIEEGATHVRIGTSIFGERNYNI